MDKQNVIYLYYEVLFNHKEDWSSDTCYNMDEPWEHYAKWNKSYTKGQILCFYLYEVSRIDKFIRDRGYQGLEKAGIGSYCLVIIVFVWGDGKVLEIDSVVMVTQHCKL